MPRGNRPRVAATIQATARGRRTEPWNARLIRVIDRRAVELASAYPLPPVDGRSFASPPQPRRSIVDRSIELHVRVTANLGSPPPGRPSLFVAVREQLACGPRGSDTIRDGPVSDPHCESLAGRLCARRLHQRSHSLDWTQRHAVSCRRYRSRRRGRRHRRTRATSAGRAPRPSDSGKRVESHAPAVQCLARQHCFDPET